MLRIRMAFLLAIAGWLDGGFDISNGLDGHAVLVVAVDELERSQDRRERFTIGY